MENGIFITRTEWNQAMKYLHRLDQRVEAMIQTRNPPKWITPEEAMKMLGCKETKLKGLRRDGKIIWKSSGKGRNVRILRESVEQFNKDNSTIL